MRRVPAILLGVSILLALVLPGVAASPDDRPVVPIVAGVHFVLAVSNATEPGSTKDDGKGEGILQGDYEMVVAIAEVAADRITEVAYFDGVDAAGVRRRADVPRAVSKGDLADAGEQVFGFHATDPGAVPGTTSLGPSFKVTRELAQKGSIAYAFRNYVSHGVVTGTLRRSSPRPVRFPVLLNGQRLELEAIHAIGQMSLGGVSRPVETIILDHPQYPLSLRIAYGPREGTFPFEPEFVREIVRIDLPATPVSMADALDGACRVELAGVYFDFNQATIKPESDRALREIAAALSGQPNRRFAIEGHTDAIGSDRYNDDLSARRAAAVKTALVRDFEVDGTRISTLGKGERQPIEPNDTLAGRARNRRVELVCAAGQ